ncbi:MAG: hypothetical protein ACO4CG_11700 [Prochlorothrix sp.]
MSHPSTTIEYAITPSHQEVILTIWVTKLYELCYHLPSMQAAWQRLNQHLTRLGNSPLSYSAFENQVQPDSLQSSQPQTIPTTQPPQAPPTLVQPTPNPAIQSPTPQSPADTRKSALPLRSPNVVPA